MECLENGGPEEMVRVVGRMLEADGAELERGEVSSGMGHSGHFGKNPQLPTVVC